MRSESTYNATDWAPLSESETARFAPQICAGLEFILRLLEETERAKKLPRTSFDQPVQERLRRAS